MFGNLFKTTSFDESNGHSPLWTECAPFATSRLTLFIILSVRARTFNPCSAKNASLTPAMITAKVEHGSVSPKVVERNEWTWSATDGTGMSDFGPVNPWTTELLMVAGGVLLKLSVYVNSEATHLRRMRNPIVCVHPTGPEGILDRPAHLRTCHQSMRGPLAMYDS